MRPELYRSYGEQPPEPHYPENKETAVDLYREYTQRHYPPFRESELNSAVPRLVGEIVFSSALLY